jgi:carbon monoxide dehydrogenase subunit G
MKVNGTATLKASLDRVYAALNDPAVLVRTIPGCQRLEQTGPDAYRMTVTAGVASIKGSYVGDVRLTDQQAPTSFVLRAKGAGAPGTVSADVTVTLESTAEGATLLSYAADAVVGGAVGGVGQRVLSGVAKKTAGEFFTAVEGVLHKDVGGAPSTGADAPVAGGAPVVAEGGAAAAPRVFTAPAVPASQGSFLQGAVFGALVALVGVAVGGAVAGRRRS